MADGRLEIEQWKVLDIAVPLQGAHSNTTHLPDPAFTYEMAERKQIDSTHRSLRFAFLP